MIFVIELTKVGYLPDDRHKDYFAAFVSFGST